jgi:hypothetical protein
MSDSEDEAPDKQLKIIIMGDGASLKIIRRRLTIFISAFNENQIIGMTSRECFEN